MITPFYFGSSRRPLLGIYHPPAGGGRAASAVVICPPIGHEYMRTHRALRTLASQLARAGHGVLRFDWSGTGDSSGEPEEARVEAWLDDFGAALDEARELINAPGLNVVGLRLGASLSVLAAADHALGTLVLWDPVVSGASFLAEQASGSGVALEGPAPGQIMSLISFPMTRPLWDEVAAIDLLAPGGLQAERVVLVEGESRPESASLRARLETSGARVTHRYIPREGDWDDMDRLGAALLPRQVLQAITEELA